MLNEAKEEEEDIFVQKGNNYGSNEAINEAVELVKDSENSGQSFQLMSIDQSGLAKIWVMILMNIIIICFFENKKNFIL